MSRGPGHRDDAAGALVTVVPTAYWLTLRVVWPLCIIGIAVPVTLMWAAFPGNVLILAILLGGFFNQLNLMPRWCALRSDGTVVARMWTGREATVSASDNAMLFAPRYGWRMRLNGWILKDDSGARVYLPPLPVNWSEFVAQLRDQGVTVTDVWDVAEFGSRVRRRRGTPTQL